ncbi:GNAT family N-acetyltransferase [Ferrimonas pelagia]|uniref:N-acetyltransferase n=1 Tax=Ferrimonas pelagia TaxID=1177826 RepID=A0ABP9EDI3_9GAMM
MNVELRLLRDEDWQQVMLLQAEVYGAAFTEPLTVLKDKQRLGPQSCWGMWLDERMVGYCLAHPWQASAPPPLGQMGLRETNVEWLMYLHDMAVGRAAQGQGLAASVLKALAEYARQEGYTRMALVAVQGASAYWQRQGFEQMMSQKSLKEYGDDACYMVKAL